MLTNHRSLFAISILLTVLNGALAVRLQILPSQSIQKKALGESMLLTCTTDGAHRNLLTDFKWLDNKNRTIERARTGVESNIYTDVLPADPGLTLFISKLTEEMAGDYTCTANYANSEELKSTVRIQTFHAIQFVDAPENQYATVNQTYRIRCEVRANPPPAIDWLKNGQLITTNEKYVVEAKGLLIQNVQESDDGQYSCRAAVILTGDLKTRHIQLEVLVPPKIEKIDSIEIKEGEIANIKCFATGKPPPQFTWIKLPNNQDLSKADRFGVNKISGALVINPVKEEDHTEYKCVAENSGGKAEQIVKVNVIVKPRIYEFLNITSPQGKSAEILCKAYGRPPPIVTFQKFGHNNHRYTTGVQESDSRIILQQQVYEQKGETHGFLSIDHLQRSDDGLYSCIAYNKGGEAYKTGHVTVEFQPTFIASKNQPPVWTWGNKPGNLSCLAESIPNATIEWRYGDYKIENSNNFKIQGNGPQSFLIVYPFNERRLFTKYKCIAVNKWGTAEHFVELREAHVPDHIAQVKVQVITATTIKFGIVPPPIGDGLPIRAFIVQYRRDREFDWAASKNRTWAVDAPYIVEELQPEMTYLFRFAAVNDVGLGPWGSQQEHTMSRRSAPDEPKILSIAEKQGVMISPYADHFDLRWRIPIDNGEPIDTYQVKYCQVRKVAGSWETYDRTCITEELNGQDNPEYRLSGLSSDTQYKIELRAHNAIGFSIPAELIVKTARGSDAPIYKSNETFISSGAIIGIVLVAIGILAFIVDLCCYCVGHTGIMMAICEKTRKKQPADDDPKLGRDEKEPLKPSSDQQPIIASMDKVSSTVEYDGRRVSLKTGEIIGKNSAV